MKQFHPDVLATIQAKALFSKAEETLLGTIPSVREYKLYKFNLLVKTFGNLFFFNLFLPLILLCYLDNKSPKNRNIMAENCSTQARYHIQTLRAVIILCN